MAEFYYYMTPDEWWPCLNEILVQEDLQAAVDRPYELPACEVYGSFAVKDISVMSRIFLFGKSFSRAPFFFRQQEGGALAGKFFIDESRGGPLLGITVPRMNARDDLVMCGPQLLYFQKIYWNDALSEAYPAPKALKDTFGRIRRTLQQRLVKHTVVRDCWISGAVWALFQSGEAAILANGLWHRLGDAGLITWRNNASKT